MSSKLGEPMSSKLEEGQMETHAGPSSPDREYQLARERAKEIQGLYIHLMVYAVINTGLFLINWLTRDPGGTWWFIWPLLGWGVGLLIHVVATFVPVFSPEWAERRAERMLGRRERRG